LALGGEEAAPARPGFDIDPGAIQAERQACRLFRTTNHRLPLRQDSTVPPTRPMAERRMLRRCRVGQWHRDAAAPRYGSHASALGRAGCRGGRDCWSGQTRFCGSGIGRTGARRGVIHRESWAPQMRRGQRRPHPADFACFSEEVMPAPKRIWRRPRK
jgi:hypothetical protein